MEIIEYDKKFKQAFIDFNTDWIEDNFGFLEKEDLDTFEHIEDELDNGAMIYFAIDNNIPLATCMAKKMDGDTWEICKLSSNKHYTHKGCGSAVFKAAMDYAINHGAKRLFLLSNSKLKPAIHIYQKFGFKEIKLDDYEYVRGNIAFEYIV
jgi:GNAT superfamily N-acetyltransferase